MQQISAFSMVSCLQSPLKLLCFKGLIHPFVLGALKRLMMIQVGVLVFFFFKLQLATGEDSGSGSGSSSWRRIRNDLVVHVKEELFRLKQG